MAFTDYTSNVTSGPSSAQTAVPSTSSTESNISLAENIGKVIGKGVDSYQKGQVTEANRSYASQMSKLQAGINQNPSQKNYYLTQASALTATEIANRPQDQKDISSIGSGILGFNAPEELYKATFQDENAKHNAINEANANNFKSAKDKGLAIYDSAGLPDYEASIANYEQSQQLLQRSIMSKNQLEAGKITQEAHDNTLKSVFSKQIGVAGNTLLHNILTQGVTMNGQVIPLSEIAAKGDPRSKAELERLIDQQGALFKVSLNASLGSTGLQPNDMKEVQERADQSVKDLKTLLTSGTIDELKTLEAQNKLFDAQANYDFNQKTGTLANMKAVMGPQAFGAQQFIFDPSVQASMANGWKSYFSGKSEEVPPAYKSAKDQALNVMHNTNQAASNPERLSQLPPEDVMAVTPVLIKGIRTMEKTPNALDPKSDKVFMNHSANLAVFGGKATPSGKDQETIANEITNPLWVQTYNAVKQRQGDAAVIANTGATVVGFLDKRLSTLDTEFTQNAPTLLKPGASSYTPATVDAEGNPVASSVKAGPSLGNIKYDPESGKLSLDTSNLKQPDEFKMRPDEYNDSKLGQFETVRMNKGMVELNKTLDTMVALKEEAGFGSMSDQAYRLQLIKSMPNLSSKLPPEVLATKEEKKQEDSVKIPEKPKADAGNPYDSIFKLAQNSVGNTAADPKDPLSVRNNNPGNIRPQGKDTGFLAFNSPQEGLQAMADDLTIKVSGKSKAMVAKFGPNYAPTLAHLVAVYAPASENNVEAYVRFLSRKLGILPTELIRPEQIPALQQAMVEQEGGKRALEYFYN